MSLAPAAQAPWQAVNSAAPGFKLKTLDGKQVSLAELRHKGPVVLDFWATWCKPCITAVPELEALHQKYAERGVTVIGISTDGPRNYSRVRPTVKKLGMTYPVGVDEDGSIQEKYGIQAMPTTMLVDTTGTIVHVLQGYRAGAIAAFGDRIDALLAPADSADTH